MRIALSISYSGNQYYGWQSQLNGNTIQDKLEAALKQFIGTEVRTICAGRTDTGVHAMQQIVHFDTDINRAEVSWVRGVNRFLPNDIAVQWARVMPDTFHARKSPLTRRYSYLLLQSAVRPSLDSGKVGWSFMPLDGKAMAQAAQYLLGEHDFSSFRAAACQSHTPIKTLYTLRIYRSPLRNKHPCNIQEVRLPKSNDIWQAPATCYWRFDFEANAFLYHMIRNIMGCLLTVGRGNQPPSWMDDVLKARSRDAASPTFSPEGLYFLGPTYAPQWNIPQSTALFDFFPSCSEEMIA